MYSAEGLRVAAAHNFRRRLVAAVWVSKSNLKMQVVTGTIPSCPDITYHLASPDSGTLRYTRSVQVGVETMHPQLLMPDPDIVAITFIYVRPSNDAVRHTAHRDAVRRAEISTFVTLGIGRCLIKLLSYGISSGRQGVLECAR